MHKFNFCKPLTDGIVSRFFFGSLETTRFSICFSNAKRKIWHTQAVVLRQAFLKERLYNRDVGNQFTPDLARLFFDYG